VKLGMCILNTLSLYKLIINKLIYQVAVVAEWLRLSITYKMERCREVCFCRHTAFESTCKVREKESNNDVKKGKFQKELAFTQIRNSRNSLQTTETRKHLISTSTNKDSKSNGLGPRRFESCRLRIYFVQNFANTSCATDCSGRKARLPVPFPREPTQIF
jgi:hypothetical protein